MMKMLGGDDEPSCENIDDTDSGDEFLADGPIFSNNNPSTGASMMSTGKRNIN